MSHYITVRLVYRSFCGVAKHKENMPGNGTADWLPLFMHRVAKIDFITGNSQITLL
jgi:hypothetical protein